MKKNLLLLFTLLIVISPLFSQTFSSSPNAPIPDNSCDASNNFPIDLTGQGISNLNSGFGVETICLNITHGWNSDLDISLEAPNGDVVLLSSDNGGSGDNYTNTCFNMEGALGLINLGTAPFTGEYVPEGDLESFTSQDPNGIWNLQACDDAFFEFGSILSWEITFGVFPLPVTLTSFNVQSIDDKNNQLTWKTASEVDNMGFEIERSGNGEDWETINFIEGNGTTNAAQSYSVIDERPLIGYNYYRLKQMDFDGKHEYSDIRSVLIDSPKQADLQVFPNPNDGQFTLSLFKPVQSDASIRVFGAEGNLIWEDFVTPSEELGHWKEELNLPAGKMYYVVSYVGDEVLSQKIIARSKR